MKFDKKIIGNICFFAAIIGGGVAYNSYSNYQQEKAKAESKAKADAEEAKRKATPHWEYMTSSDTSEYSAYLPPRETIMFQEPIKTVWIRRDYKGGHSKVLYSISCKHKTTSSEQIVTYDSKDKVTSDYSYPQEWKNAIAGSVMGSIVEKVCNY